MATIIYRPARLALLNAQIQMGVDPLKFRFVLVEEGSSFMDEHPANMTAFSLLSEVASAGYVRYAPSGLSVLTDVAKDRVYVASTLITPTFNLTAGDNIIGCVLYWVVGSGDGVDADNIPMMGFELAAPYLVKPATESYVFPLPEEGIMEMPEFGERIYLIGRKNLLEGRKQFTSGFSLALYRTDSNFLSIQNPSVLGDLTNKFAGSGYADQAMSFTLETDATRDRIKIGHADVDFGVLGDDAAAIMGGAVYIPGLVNGVANTLVYGLRLAQPVNPGGAAFIFPINEDGVAYL